MRMVFGENDWWTAGQKRWSTLGMGVGDVEFGMGYF